MVALDFIYFAQPANIDSVSRNWRASLGNLFIEKDKLEYTCEYCSFREIEDVWLCHILGATSWWGLGGG